MAVKIKFNGIDTGTFDFEIKKTGPIFDLSWHKNGKLLFVGVGIETSDGMAAGWQKSE
ncbi:MAG: hypothetical protein GY718_03830 [Lentisphaerae bacterium]|nr:hypothetical protein [Lentisphaerota bacterium]